MAGIFDVQITVESQKGHCRAGHKVGDQWTVSDKTPGDMCLAGFSALYPNLRVLRFGGSFPWEADPDTSSVACPDDKNPVVFTLKRLEK